MQSKKTKNARVLKKTAKKCTKFIRDHIRHEDIRMASIVSGFKKHGLEYTEVGVSNTIGRGAFNLPYFLMLCKILGIETIDIKDILELSLNTSRQS